MDASASGLEVRRYSRDDVELALLAVAEGMSRQEAAEIVGCGETAVRNWLAGRLPRSCSPSPPLEYCLIRRLSILVTVSVVTIADLAVLVAAALCFVRTISRGVAPQIAVIVPD